MINKAVALFTFVSFILMACNDPTSGQTENENQKSVETTTTIQDESHQEKNLKNGFFHRQSYLFPCEFKRVDRKGTGAGNRKIEQFG
ncbi:hypothetical protein [Peribacillus simplex]|uniref:hypothetical protein n=1 Tax=Peribacillus simplex TaxID=1478 RepID=UPI0033396C4C